MKREKTSEKKKWLEKFEKFHNETFLPKIKPILDKHLGEVGKNEEGDPEMINFIREKEYPD